MVSFRQLVLIGVPLFALNTWAALPANCIDRLKQESERKLQSVESSLDEINKSQENQFNNIDKTWREFAAYYKGNWAMECVKVVPENEADFNVFLKDRATPLLHRVGARMKELCTAISRERIGAHMDEIHKYASEGNAKVASKKVEFLKKEIEKNKIISRCSPMKDELARLMDVEIPTILGQAQLAGEMKTITSYFPNVVSTWNSAQAAFEKKTEAPGYLEGKQGQTDYSNAVEKSLASIQALQKGGMKAESALVTVDGKSMSLGEASQLATQISAGLGDLFSRVEAHNKQLEKEGRAAWENAHVKGEGMTAVFRENKKRIPATEDLGSQVIWTYRSYTSGNLFSDCKEYVFKADGSLLSRRVYKCE